MNLPRFATSFEMFKSAIAVADLRRLTHIARSQGLSTEDYLKQVYERVRKVPGHVSSLLRGAGANDEQIAAAQPSNGAWFVPDHNRPGKFLRLNLG